MYLLTRPAPTIWQSQAVFDEAGLSVSVLGAIDIIALPGGVFQLEKLVSQSPPDCVVITSKFAVHACAGQLKAMPSQTEFISVGTGTATALTALGRFSVQPETASSEGLLALPQLIDAKSKQIIIIKGESGRTTLATQLANRGAKTHPVAVYQRIHPATLEQTNQWQWPDVKGIIATSEEMSERLFTYLDNTQLQTRPWLTVSERVADKIRQQGVNDINVAGGASDVQLSQWIKENWE